MDLTTLTETELKSLGYEQVKMLNAAQNNLALIEQELAKRVHAQGLNSVKSEVADIDRQLQTLMNKEGE